MKKLCAIVFFTSVLITCAAPQEVMKLSPEAPGGNFEMGREYIFLSSDSIQVELGFDGFCDENMVFDLVVFNNTGHPLSIDPAEFYYELLDSATSDSSRVPPKMAVIPEKILDRYEDDLEYTEIERGINAVMGVIESGIGFITHATSFMDAFLGSVGPAHYHMVRDRQISDGLEQITLEKEVVEEEILRKDQVPPGKVASGFVFFPGHSDPAYLMFCFPLEDQLFQFVYQQYTEEPDR
jgi:hypothetical protein